MYKYLITIVKDRISTIPVTNDDFTKEKSFEIDDCTFLHIGHYYAPETSCDSEDDDEEEYYDEYKLYLPISINQSTFYVNTDVLLDNFNKEPLSVHVEDRRINLTDLLTESLT